MRLKLLELLKLLKLLICRCFLSLPRLLSGTFVNHFEYSWRRRCLGLGRTGGKISDHRQRRLLRPRGKRPHSGSAANDFDEVASSHCRRIGSKDVSGRGRTTRGYVRFGSKASGAGNHRAAPRQAHHPRRMRFARCDFSFGVTPRKRSQACGLPQI